MYLPQGYSQSTAFTWPEQEDTHDDLSSIGSKSGHDGNLSAHVASHATCCTDWWLDVTLCRLAVVDELLPTSQRTKAAPRQCTYRP
jgi:hypothetical protein